MQACQSSQPANRISLSPHVKQWDLVPEQPLMLTATGTSSSPAVNLFNDQDKAIDLQSQANGNQLTTTLKLTKTDKNVNARLEFSSGDATPVSVALIYFVPPKAKK